MTGKAPVQHECAQCGKRFSQRGNLTTHIRIVHEHRRDFHCSYCGKGFSVKTSMRNHVRSVHEQRRDYVCEICGKAFTEKGSLQRHIRGVHEKRRDFACPECNKGFPDKSALRKHLRAVHNLNLSEQTEGGLSVCQPVPRADTGEGHAADIMLTLMGNTPAEAKAKDQQVPPALSTLQSLAAIVGAVAQNNPAQDQATQAGVQLEAGGDAMPTPATQPAAPPAARVEQNGPVVVVTPVAGDMQSVLADEQKKMQAAIAAATAMPMGQIHVPGSSSSTVPGLANGGSLVLPLPKEAFAALNNNSNSSNNKAPSIAAVPISTLLPPEPVVLEESPAKKVKVE